MHGFVELSNKSLRIIIDKAVADIKLYLCVDICLERLKPREPNGLANYLTFTHGNSLIFHNCRQKTNLSNPHQITCDTPN
jgi:hypothetical protein